MPLASTSKTQMAYVEETTFGVTPVAGDPLKLRMTGESLNYDIQSESSAEINDTRQTSDSVHVGATAQGGINLELSYREYDPFLESLLAGSFAALGVDGVIAVAAATFNTGANTIACTVTEFAGIVDGQWISVLGAAAGTNVGVYRVAIATDSLLTLDTDTPLSADIGPVVCDVTASRLSNGVEALRSFSLEKNFSDVTQFFLYKGMSPSKLSLSFDTGALLKGALDFMGAKGDRAAVTFMPSAPGASQSFGIMNAVTGVGTILLDEEILANTYIKSAKIDIDAKLRGQDAIANLGNVGLGQGTFEIGGTLEMYLADGAIYDKALANTSVDIQIPVYDVAGNGYAFIFKNVKFGVPTVQAGAKDADVMLSVPFKAIAPDTSVDKMIIIDRFGVAGV